MRRVMEVSTPRGEDVLLFQGMRAQEGLGRLGEFQIDLLSERGDINLDEILAKNITVQRELPQDQVRYFNGYVTRFTQTGMHGRYHHYHPIVHPWLWFLRRTSKCCIFQGLSVPDILKQIFDDHAQIANVKKELTGSYRTWDYCVQYRESGFNFVSRLMEQEDIYYYFKHADGQHTLILADSYTAHGPFAGYETLPFLPQERADMERAQRYGLTAKPEAYDFITLSLLHGDTFEQRPENRWALDILSNPELMGGTKILQLQTGFQPRSAVLKPRRA